MSIIGCSLSEDLVGKFLALLIETFAKRLFSPPALLANAHLQFINSALPPSWEQKSLFLQTVSAFCKAL